jgi:hypothetical protein
MGELLCWQPGRIRRREKRSAPFFPAGLLSENGSDYDARDDVGESSARALDSLNPRGDAQLPLISPSPYVPDQVAQDAEGGQCSSTWA